ncbi:MAG: carboxypeptidase M32 [Actinobacteria bacterium]|nr:carboxypeptidase M32 [Actinomycetota bacterium]MBV8480009.1 carboxypeptidase M32 [Actinomycetota bacterium]
MSAEHRFDELLRRLGGLDDLVRAGTLLGWDEETKMPPAGAEARAEQRATLEELTHERRVDPDLGDLLEELRPFEEAHPHDSFEAGVIRVARRDYEKAIRVPPPLQARLERAGSLGYRAWLRARAENDYSIMLPLFEENLELRREYVACFDPKGDPYDVVLDDYEPGMTTAEVEAIFDRLKERLVPMIRAVGEAEPVDDSCLRGSFSRPAQHRVALAILEAWGIDDESWRLDYTVHPFEVSMAVSDIRLTTRFDEDNIHGILSCLHEFGHGLYERQIDPSYSRTSLADGVSSAVHESQSRLWENLVGRRLSTWRFFYPTLQRELPVFCDVPLETFHRALNRVRPTFRRVDADEVTYCLHVILRFELERELLSGRLAPRDLPEAFDAKMREYLGLQPPDLASGVLQDVHWSDMSLGYFPTYALGNVVSVQLWERAEAALGDFDEQFERGEFAPLAGWLREHIHRHGRMFEPQELLRREVGSGMDPEPYLGYLQRQLEELFGAVVA